MYVKFFGLRTLPFEDRADTQFFYPTAECQKALAALVSEIHHGTGMGLLIGEAGTGKTLLLRTLLPRLEKSHQTVVVTWPANGAMALVRECCKGFGVTLPYSHNQSSCLNRLRRHLGRCARAGIRSILIVDQAENLSLDNIAQIATLAELCGERGKLLTVILAAQPLVRALLDRPEFAWIRQQLFGERTLSPLTPKETGEYIRHRLQIAGAVDTRLFDDRAISLIQEISEGVPRLINRICHAAMLVANAAQTPRISRTIVEEATARPPVRERTIAARDLGPAMIGKGGAPWLSVSESPDRMAGWAEADDTGSDERVTSGASIVDGEYEGFHGELFGLVPNKGTFLLARLERAMARAERMANSTEASLSRLEAVGQHLASLVDQAERQTSHLERTLSEFPPIRQTHPTEAARRLSRAVEPFTRITGEAGGGQLQVLSEPDFDATPVEPRIAKSPTHAQEIAQLISEAIRQ